MFRKETGLVKKSCSMNWMGLTLIFLLAFSCGFRSQVKKEVTEADETRRWVPMITKNAVTLRPIGRDLQVIETEHHALSKARQNAKDFPEIGDCPLNGGVSFDNYDWDFEPYLLHVKRKIEPNIVPPWKFSQGSIEGKSLLRFKIESGGELMELELVSYQGHTTLAETSLLAVEFAAPFEVLPEDLLKKQDHLTVTAMFCYFLRKK